VKKPNAKRKGSSSDSAFKKSDGALDAHKAWGDAPQVKVTLKKRAGGTGLPARGWIRGKKGGENFYNVDAGSTVGVRESGDSIANRRAGGNESAGNGFKDAWGELNF